MSEDANTEDVAEAPASDTRAEHDSFTIKVNGEDLTLQREEVITLAQRGASADRKFQEAAELRREAEERIREAEELRARQERGEDERTDESTDDAAARVSEEDEAVRLARELQMLDEREAAERIREIKARQVTPEQFASAVNVRARSLYASERFKRDFPDLVADPMLMELVYIQDERQLAAGDRRPFEDRYREIGEGLRRWLGVKAPVKPADVLNAAAKRERKALHASQQVRAANIRQAAPAEEDTDVSPSAVIDQMAKARGQQVVRRSNA